MINICKRIAGKILQAFTEGRENIPLQKKNMLDMDLAEKAGLRISVMKDFGFQVRQKKM